MAGRPIAATRGREEPDPCRCTCCLSAELGIPLEGVPWGCDTFAGVFTLLGDFPGVTTGDLFACGCDLDGVVCDGDFPGVPCVSGLLGVLCLATGGEALTLAVDALSSRLASPPSDSVFCVLLIGLGEVTVIEGERTLWLVDRELERAEGAFDSPFFCEDLERFEASDITRLREGVAGTPAPVLVLAEMAPAKLRGKELGGPVNDVCLPF